MAEADLLDVPALDKAAGEEFLQEAFGVILEEAVRRGTDVAEKERMMKAGSKLVGYQLHDSKDNFICQIVTSPVVTRQDKDEIERLGRPREMCWGRAPCPVPITHPPWGAPRTLTPTILSTSPMGAWFQCQPQLGRGAGAAGRHLGPLQIQSLVFTEN